MLRPATPADAPACAAILGEFFERTPWLPRLHTPAEDQAFLAHLIAEADVTIADADGVQGYSATRGTDLDHLYLAPSARRQGIGTALLTRAKTGRDRLRLWCFQQNIPALAFYAAQGFTEIGRTDGQDNEERLPDIQLEWRAA